MASQVVAIFLLLLARIFPGAQLDLPAYASLWVAVLLALGSGLDYFRRFGSEALRSPLSAAPPDRRR